MKMLDKRITEATKLGFARVVVPAGSQVSPRNEGLVVRCANVQELLAILSRR